VNSNPASGTSGSGTSRLRTLNLFIVVPTIDPTDTKEATDTQENKKEEKLEEESAKTLDMDANVLAQTLTSMPVENLRQLLAGAKVNIQIKFPKLEK